MMEVSNEIKEDIRKTQTELKNAFRVHQIWVARLRDDKNNAHFKNKISEAETSIVAICQAQKLVVNRIRRELELYQQRLRARNKQINIENDNKYVAQQLRDFELLYNRNCTVSLLKPSVLNEIQIKTENVNNDVSDSDNENKYNSKENTNSIEINVKDNYVKNSKQFQNINQDSRSHFTNELNKVKETFCDDKVDNDDSESQENHSDSDSTPGMDISPTPSPPLLPESGEHVHKDVFLNLLGLITFHQKDLVEKKWNRRKRPMIDSKGEFIYSNYENMLPKRKKFAQYPYLQSHNDPPQTRSAKLKKQQNQNNTSREGSPSGSSSENKEGWSNTKPAWVAALPAGLSVEPVYSPTKKVCHGCGRNDVPSLLVWCGWCARWWHTGCGDAGRCTCGHDLPEPAVDAVRRDTVIYRDKLAERKRLQEKNIELCDELRKLETRAATLKDNLDEHNEEKRQLLADQIQTQRNLQKLLDFLGQFKDASEPLSISTSASESGSELSRSNEE